MSSIFPTVSSRSIKEMTIQEVARYTRMSPLERQRFDNAKALRQKLIARERVRQRTIRRLADMGFVIRSIEQDVVTIDLNESSLCFA
jgi:hypothetical protein